MVFCRNVFFHIILKPLFCPCRTKQSAAHNEFLDYLGEAYSCFLEGDDEAYNALNADFASGHEAARVRSEERTKELEEAMERLHQQILEVLPSVAYCLCRAV